MKIKVALILLAALTLQYVLMSSHKAGSSHWTVVAVISVLSFFAALLLTSKSGLSRKWSVGSIFGASVCLILPSTAYLWLEWREAPVAVANSLNRFSMDYLAMLVIFSGGWAFAAALLIHRGLSLRS